MDHASDNKPVLFVSPTSMAINLAGLGCFVLVFAAIKLYGQSLSWFQAVSVLLVSLVLPILVLEFLFLRTYRRASTGFDFSIQVPAINTPRFFIKIVGLCGTLGFLALIYWLFPEYRGSFYDRYRTMLKYITPLFVALAVPYFWFTDRYMQHARDGYYHMGLFVMGRWASLDRGLLGQHIRGWIVKGFFLPLMFLGFCDNIANLRGMDFSLITQSFKGFYDTLYIAFFTVDLAFVTVGYMLSIRLFDTHIRSTEPTFLGWMVALECYSPFWPLFSRMYLNYSDLTSWGYWFNGGGIAYCIWGTIILILLGIYVWATIPFGIRFSNLTNRGILTNGPYQFTKHPAYVSKNIAWWLMSMPFLSAVSISEAVRHSILLLIINGIYFLRARTEERHLSSDPDYIRYGETMEQIGMFSWVGRLIPALRFKAGRMFNIQ